MIGIGTGDYLGQHLEVCSSSVVSWGTDYHQYFGQGEGDSSGIWEHHVNPSFAWLRLADGIKTLSALPEPFSLLHVISISPKRELISSPKILQQFSVRNCTRLEICNKAMAERRPVTSCITTFRANTPCRERTRATAIHEVPFEKKSKCRGLPQTTCTRPLHGGPAWGSCHELSQRTEPGHEGMWLHRVNSRSQGEQGSLSWGIIPSLLLCPVSRVVFTKCFTSNSIFFSKGWWHSFPTVSFPATFCNPLPYPCPFVPWNRVQILLSFLQMDLPFLLCPVQGYNNRRSFGTEVLC